MIDLDGWVDAEDLGIAKRSTEDHRLFTIPKEFAGYVSCREYGFNQSEAIKVPEVGVSLAFLLLVPALLFLQRRRR